MLLFLVDICIIITFKILFIFIYGCPESLLQSMGFLYLQQAGASLVVVRGLLMEVASLVEEHRLSGVQVLAAEAHGLSSGSRAPEHRLSGSWA